MMEYFSYFQYIVLRTFLNFYSIATLKALSTSTPEYIKLVLASNVCSNLHSFILYNCLDDI